jgi:hypothetical protein
MLQIFASPLISDQSLGKQVRERGAKKKKEISLKPVSGLELCDIP